MNQQLTPPPHLSEEATAWWVSVTQEFELEPHHARLLQAAAEAWDRLVEARTALAEHGLTYTDRFGAPRLRPEAAIERDARIGFVRVCRELGLQDQPERRPPTLKGRYQGRS